MTTMKGGEVVLKTDGMGRVQTPAARRESLLDEFERSGLSGTRFAALAGIKYQTFAAWAHRRRKQRAGRDVAQVPAADKLRWLEAVIEQVPPALAGSASLALLLPGEVRVEISEPNQVVLAAALVRALAQPATAC